MFKRSEQHSEQCKDIRVTATTRIWSFATGMLALCMIFSPTRSNIAAPIAIASSAVLGTAFVWKSDKKSQSTLEDYQLQDIEHRLNTLETIAAADDFEMWVKTKYIESRN